MRIFIRLLTVFLLLGTALFAGCSDDPEPLSAPRSAPCPEMPKCPPVVICPPTTSSLKAADEGGRLQAVIKRGELRCGVRNNIVPFGFQDEHSSHIIGFEADLCRAIARLLDVRVHLVSITAANRVRKLLRGEVDLIAATMTHHHSREDLLDFSITYFMDGQKIMVREGSDIHSVTDLVARRVGVVEGSWAAANLVEAQSACKTVEFGSYAEAFMALKRNHISAISADSTILLGLRNSDPDPAAFSIVGDYITDEPYALGLPENDSDFRDVVNLALQRLWLSGEYMKIYNRWFGPHTKFFLPTKWRMELWPGARKKNQLADN